MTEPVVFTMPRVIDLERGEADPWPVTRRAQRVADRAVAASVRDVRDRGPAGVHLALGRLMVTAERCAEIDADETRKKASAARASARADRRAAE